MMYVDVLDQCLDKIGVFYGQFPNYFVIIKGTFQGITYILRYQVSTLA